MQEALIQALATWPADPPADPKGWLTTVAWRKFLDATAVRDRPAGPRGPGRGRAAARPDRGRRRHPAAVLPVRPPVAHPGLGGGAHAAGGRRPDHPADRARPTWCPRRRWPSGSAGPSGPSPACGFDEPGDLATVLRVLYLVFNEGYSGEVDLADEAIRLTRQVTLDDRRRGGVGPAGADAAAPCPARRPDDARTARWSRWPSRTASRWDTELIAEGVAILQAALARDRLGEYQAQAAIAALHADARTADETDWVQIVEWYDELVRLTDSPVVRLNRAVAVGEADGARAGLAALAQVDPALPRYQAVAAYLRERAGDLVTRGAAVRRRGPRRHQPGRTRPPDPPGRPAARTTALDS